jgi:hypothetical protein
LEEKIYHYLLYQKPIDKGILNEIVEMAEGLEIHYARDFMKFYEQVVEPRLGESSQDLIGIYNAEAKDLVEERLGVLRRFANTTQAKNEVEYIEQLLAKDSWQSVGKNIRAMMEPLVERLEADDEEESNKFRSLFKIGD